MLPVIKFAFILLQVALVSGTRTQVRTLSLDALYRNEKLELNSLSQLRSLVGQIGHSHRTQRPDSLASALKDFQAVVEAGKENVCSLHMVNLYERFYLDNLKSTKHTRDSRPLPKSFRRLVLAYGMQLSNACKWKIYSELGGQIKSLIADDDFKALSIYINKTSALAQFVGATKYPDELFLPADLLGAKLAGEQSEWVMSEGLARSNLLTLKEKCERRFEPIYEPLMMPVARLARLGFNYRDEELKIKSKDPKAWDEVSRWPRVVFLCELVKSIKLMSLEEEELEAKEMEIQKTTMKVLSEDEVNEIVSLDGEMLLDDDDISKLKYVAAFEVRLDDLILDPNNKRLVKAVDSFKTSRSPEKVLRQRRRSNLFGIIKNLLQRFRIHSAASTFIKYIWTRLDVWLGFRNDRKELAKGLEQELVRHVPKPKERFMQFAQKGFVAIVKLTLVTSIVIFVLCMFVCF